MLLDLRQVQPNGPEKIRMAGLIRVRGVKGKRGTERNVFLLKDTREALFLGAAGTPARRQNERSSVRAVNLILEHIGCQHDVEISDFQRRISPLRPQDLRYSFSYRLAAETNKDVYELEPRPGHGSLR